MTDNESNIDVVRRAFAAITNDDWPTMRRLIRDDVTWHVPGRSKVAGDTIGVEAFAAKVQMLVEWGLHIELLNVMAAGDHVVTLQRNSASSDRGELDILVMNLFTVIDGKLVRMQAFPSDQYALDSFWGS